MATKMTALFAYRTGKLRLPPGYHIEGEAGLITLYRPGDSPVGVFTEGAAPPAVIRAAEDDYRANSRYSA